MMARAEACTQPVARTLGLASGVLLLAVLAVAGVEAVRLSVRFDALKPLRFLNIRNAHSLL